MDYEDRISIVTPEGVTLELTLAGIGSRFVAHLLDWCICLALYVGLLLLTGTFGDAAPGPAVAVVILGGFLIMFGYDVLFETLASGRTPGKRWTGLRVVMVGGGPVGFLASTIRNLVRLIDLLPGVYLVGIVSMLATSRNQRVGDLAAATLVVRERRIRPAEPAVRTGFVPTVTSHWDVSAVTMEELSTIRRFLERRAELLPEARARLANQLASRMRPKVVGPGDELSPEAFLEALAAAKSARV